jgi:twitching motility protein PilT
MDVDALLAETVKRGASDLHLKVGTPPMVRINGNLRPMLDRRKVNQEDTAAISAKIMNLRQKKQFKECHEVDLAYGLAGVSRFRVNIFQQRGSIGIVFRTIQTRIKAIRELLLPNVLEKLSMENRGLILVTGATGSGKSTTLAAMLDFVNQNRAAHILTIEDPIEFLHKDKKSIVNQREVGADTNEFLGALRSAMRQDPDIILVGEMRDKETVETALRAAETGHLVLSTLHTLDAVETLNRIIGIFPAGQQDQIRIQLAAVLSAVVSQRLVPRKDGRGRLAAIEILVNTELVREYILDKGRSHKLHGIIEKGAGQYGMQTFDQHLIKLVNRGLVNYDDALAYSSRPDDFALRYSGIGGTRDISEEDGGHGTKSSSEIKMGSKVDDDEDPFSGMDIFNQ